MKRTDIMINDWVYLSDATKYAMRVLSIDEDTCYLDFEGNKGDPFDGIYGEGGIAPIPMTKEMLELNGWTCFEGYWTHKNIIDIAVRFKTAFTQWCIRNLNHYDDYEWVEVDRIGYVHELQHVLRILGYGDMADNFKIK